jgi:hypothetical protein
MRPGWGYPPAPPPGWGYRPPGRWSGVLALVLVTAGLWLAAPHARALRPHVEGLRGILAGQLPDLPAIRLPRLPDRAAPARPSPRAGAAVAYALAQRGKPYRWGAEGPAAFDCSGLTFAAWRHAGASIPRTAAGQLADLPPARGPLRPGDLVVYRSDGPTRRHVAIVVAPGLMVEALGVGIPVRSTRLRGGWLGAVRPGGR